MLTQITNYAVDAANDQLHKRERTVPIPNTITAVAGYPNKLVVFKIAASKFWQVRCFVAGRTHRRTTKTTSKPSTHLRIEAFRAHSPMLNLRRVCIRHIC